MASAVVPVALDTQQSSRKAVTAQAPILLDSAENFPALGTAKAPPPTAPSGADFLDDLLNDTVAPPVPAPTKGATVAAVATSLGGDAEDLLDGLLGDVGSDILQGNNDTRGAAPVAGAGNSADDLLDDLLAGVDASVLKSSSNKPPNNPTESHDDILDDLLGQQTSEQLSASVEVDPLDELLADVEESLKVKTTLTVSGGQGHEVDRQDDDSNQREVVKSSKGSHVVGGVDRIHSHVVGGVDRIHSPDEMQRDPRRPYAGYEVLQISSHLNIMNRRSKAVQMECQQLFLRLYFTKRVEVI